MFDDADEESRRLTRRELDHIREAVEAAEREAGRDLTTEEVARIVESAGREFWRSLGIDATINLESIEPEEDDE